MWYEAVLGVAVALFAAYGLCCAVRLTVNDIFGPRLPVAVTVTEADSADTLREKLVEARSVAKRGGIVVLIPRSRVGDAELYTVVELFCADRKIIAEQE